MLSIIQVVCCCMNLELLWLLFWCVSTTFETYWDELYLCHVSRPLPVWTKLCCPYKTLHGCTWYCRLMLLSPGRHQTTHTFKPPACRIGTGASSVIFYLLYSPLSHRCRTRETCPSRLRSGALRWSAGCANLTPPFKPKVRLPWPGKPGRWQSEFSFS